MLSEIAHYNTSPSDPCIAVSPEHNLHINWFEKLDSRRFASIFPLEIPEDVSVDCGDATDEEEYDNNSDHLSRWDFIAADSSTLPTQPSSVASMEEGTESSVTAAQQIVECYRAVHASDHETQLECGSTDINKKELPQIPDDQRSMYTLATGLDAQSSMDMMWRPKPKVHLRRNDQPGLIEAQAQALEMMRNAGLKPTNKIQCRRRGCADILRDVEALKYHLHIHNISDGAAGFSSVSPPVSRKPSLVDPTPLKRVKSNNSHARSKSSAVVQRKNSATSSSAPRKLSAGVLFPSSFPSPETPETQYAPSLTAVATSLVLDASPSNLVSPLSATLIKELSPAPAPAPSRGRRTRKETIIATVGAGYNASIAMILSPPSSPTMGGRALLAPRMNLPMPVDTAPITAEGNSDCTIVTNDSTSSISGKLKRARSPTRALSPVRALSPIRKGLRRVLSVGCSLGVTDE